MNRIIGSGLILAAVMLSGIPVAQATAVVCGNPTLGLRVTTVDPAASCTYAGLQNLGDGALESLMNTLTGDTDSTLIDRDTSNNNGGALAITGVGGVTGTWSFLSSAWTDWTRVFLYFHFGDANDDPGTTSTTDPDVFIVELSAADITGSWSFGGGKQTGLSNIALIGSDKASSGSSGGASSGGDIPEPNTGSMALLGLGLLAGSFAWRRRTRRA